METKQKFETPEAGQWVPRRGQMARVNKPDCPKFHGQSFNVRDVGETYAVLSNAGVWSFCYLEPAPLTPAAGEAGKEDSPVAEAQRGPIVPGHPALAKETGGRVVPSGANSGRYNGNDLERERLMCAEMKREDEMPLTLHGPSRRDRLIAALAAEQSQTLEERRRALHPHEGRSERVYGGRRW